MNHLQKLWPSLIINQEKSRRAPVKFRGTPCFSYKLQVQMLMISNLIVILHEWGFKPLCNYIFPHMDHYDKHRFTSDPRNMRCWGGDHRFRLNFQYSASCIDRLCIVPSICSSPWSLIIEVKSCKFIVHMEHIWITEGQWYGQWFGHKQDDKREPHLEKYNNLFEGV